MELPDKYHIPAPSQDLLNQRSQLKTQNSEHKTKNPMPLPLSPYLKTLPTYQPGRPIEEVARELGLPTDSILKVASNENPFGPSALAAAAMRKAISSVN